MSEYQFTREGRLYSKHRCVVCGGKHDGANLVKLHPDGYKPVHVLCADDYERAIGGGSAAVLVPAHSGEGGPDEQR